MDKSIYTDIDKDLAYDIRYVIQSYPLTDQATVGYIKMIDTFSDIDDQDLQLIVSWRLYSEIPLKCWQIPSCYCALYNNKSDTCTIIACLECRPDLLPY